MNTCKWDGDKGDYVTDDSEPCKRDQYGDPTTHCQARRTCSNHVATDELTCARCLGRTRADIRQISDLSALMPTAAIAEGVNSEAANLAGPAADVEAWSWRKVAAKQGVAWHVSLVEEDDELHPYSVLARWEFMLREDYDQQRETATSINQAAGYLDRTLGKVAQDPEQDFPLMAREIRKCRQHLENVLHDSRAKERGAPCPTCAEDSKFVRLTHEFAHWCEDAECERIHSDSAEDDMWVCPRKPAEHRWTEAAYRNYVEERTA